MTFVSPLDQFSNRSTVLNTHVENSKPLDEFTEDYRKECSDLQLALPPSDFLASSLSSFQQWNREMFAHGAECHHDVCLLARLSFAMIWCADPDFYSLSIELHRVLFFKVTASSWCKLPNGSVITDGFIHFLNSVKVFPRNGISLTSGSPRPGNEIYKLRFFPQDLQGVKLEGRAERDPK
jgi:hypothetical protein